MQAVTRALVGAIVFSCTGVVGAPNVAYAATYFEATFTGAVFGNTAAVKDPFLSTVSRGAPISGSFVFESELIPGVATNFVNVPFSTFADIGQIPTATAFNIGIGSLSFDLGDSVDTTASIQYRKGKFNGFAYTSQFNFQGSEYLFSIQGLVFSVALLSNPASPFISGFINGDLSNLSPFSPGAGANGEVPLPAALPLFGTILAGGGLAAWRRKRKAAKAAA